MLLIAGFRFTVSNPSTGITMGNTDRDRLKTMSPFRLKAELE